MPRSHGERLGSKFPGGQVGCGQRRRRRGRGRRGGKDGLCLAEACIRRPVGVSQSVACSCRPSPHSGSERPSARASSASYSARGRSPRRAGVRGRRRGPPERGFAPQWYGRNRPPALSRWSHAQGFRVNARSAAIWSPRPASATMRQPLLLSPMLAACQAHRAPQGKGHPTLPGSVRPVLAPRGAGRQFDIVDAHAVGLCNESRGGHVLSTRGVEQRGKG